MLPTGGLICIENWWRNMSAQDNKDDRFDKLTNTVRWIINENSQQLSELLTDISEWNDFAIFFARQNEAYDKDIESIVQAFKNYAEQESHRKKLNIEEVNYDETVKQINFLLRQIVVKNEYSLGNNQFSYKTPSIKKESIAWMLVLIAYIYSSNGEQSTDDFAKTFIRLITPLQKNAEKIKGGESIDNPQDPSGYKKTDYTEKNKVAHENNTTTLNKTLILVFGQSQLAGVNEIQRKKKFNDSDYELLKKYEWFWYGESGNTTPTEISKDEQGNMCWLQLDMKSNSILQVKSRLHFIELIDKIKKEQITVTQMKIGGLFQLATSGLSGKGFIKA